MTDSLLTVDYQERENRAKVLFSLSMQGEGGRLGRAGVEIGSGELHFSLCFFLLGSVTHISPWLN